MSNSNPAFVAHGKRKLLEYARRFYPQITEEEEALQKALYDFKIDAAKVAFNPRELAERRRDLKTKWRMDHTTAFHLIRDISEKEREDLMKHYTVDIDDMTKREILSFSSAIEQRKFGLLTSFVKFEQLPEVVVLKSNIADEGKDYQQRMILSLRLACLRLGEFESKVLMPKDLIDPVSTSELWNRYMNDPAKGLIAIRQAEAREVQRKRTGSEAGWERVYNETFFPRTSKIRLAIRRLEEAHNYSAIISGEKDPKLKVRIGVLDDVRLEAIQRALSKPEFVTLVTKFKETFSEAEWLKYRALACFAAGTATRVGETMEQGILGIRLRDLNLDRQPPRVLVYDKKTKRRPTGEWNKPLPNITIRTLSDYLAKRYGVANTPESIIKICQEHRDEKLFPETYDHYLKVFREALNAIGLQAVDRPFHSLRHSFVDWMAETELGLNLLAIATLGGWDNIDTMTEHYFGGAAALVDSWALEAYGQKKREPVPFEKGLEEI